MGCERGGGGRREGREEMRGQTEAEREGGRGDGRGRLVLAINLGDDLIVWALRERGEQTEAQRGGGGRRWQRRDRLVLSIKGVT